MNETSILYLIAALFFYYKVQYVWGSVLEPMLNFFNTPVFSLEEDLTKEETKEEAVVKYEDKYLIDIRKMEKEYIWDEKEILLLKEKETHFMNTFLEEEKRKHREKETLFEEEHLALRETFSENKDLALSSAEPFLKVEVEEYARNFIINIRLEKLMDCFVIEHTPQGNVLMHYNIKKNSFSYYSDHSIPYRYLEVVGRKFVKQFDCRPLYVDMEEELQMAEERWQKEKEKEEEEKKKKEEQKEGGGVPEKKNVFAKFKSYNKEGAFGRVSKGVPPKNSIPITKEQEKEKILLKERANRYTYEGKMANFSFLKKVERKLVDKKYGLSFADFKKMQKN
jgi:hypothetical protein